MTVLGQYTGTLTTLENNNGVWYVCFVFHNIQYEHSMETEPEDNRYFL